tara:strand:+ start:148 stop:327 length:180 start_codon:yes stop_codon:yes gene_type:complete
MSAEFLARTVRSLYAEKKNETTPKPHPSVEYGHRAEPQIDPRNSGSISQTKADPKRKKK